MQNQGLGRVNHALVGHGGADDNAPPPVAPMSFRLLVDPNGDTLDVDDNDNEFSWRAP